MNLTKLLRLSRTGTVAIGLALLLCQRPAAAAPLEISYWTGWSGHELAIQRRLVEKFEAQHPGLKVHIMTVAGSYEKVTLSFAAGNPPDLMSSVWTEDLRQFRHARRHSPAGRLHAPIRSRPGPRIHPGNRPRHALQRKNLGPHGDGKLRIPACQPQADARRGSRPRPSAPDHGGTRRRERKAGQVRQGRQPHAFRLAAGSPPALRPHLRRNLV